MIYKLAMLYRLTTTPSRQRSCHVKRLVIKAVVLIVSLTLYLEYRTEYDAPHLTLTASPVYDNKTHEPPRTFVHKIGFLKVHKASSTTVQNILFRFGLKYNLAFVLPKKSNYIYSTNEAIPLKSKKYYDIFAIHTIYKRRMFDALLSTASVNIGIVRDPLERMISAAYFYRDKYKYSYLLAIPNETFIQELVSNPEKYDCEKMSLTKNSIGRDFGLSESYPNDNGRTLKHDLEDLENEFSLVMLTEKFDESLILFKRMLNWTFSDILYMSSNLYPHPKTNLTNLQIEKFRQTCYLDYVIYDLFKEIFKQKVIAAGSDFPNEVIQFKKVLEIVSKFCNDTKNDKNQSDKSLFVRETEWNRDFNVSKTDCELMKRREMPFIDDLRERHYRTYGRKQNHTFVYMCGILVLIVVFMIGKTIFCNRL